MEMEIRGNRVRLSQAEADAASCPIDKAWAIGMLRRFGLPLAASSRGMAPFLACQDLVEGAGYGFDVVEEVPNTNEPEATADEGLEAAQGHDRG